MFIVFFCICICIVLFLQLIMQLNLLSGQKLKLLDYM